MFTIIKKKEGSCIYGNNIKRYNWGGGTTFSASPATVSVPTGSVYVGRNTTFTVPAGVKVIYVKMDNSNYVGVMPNSRHTLTWYYASTILKCNHNKEWGRNNEAYKRNATIYWSPEINNMTPTITDY